MCDWSCIVLRCVALSFVLYCCIMERKSERDMQGIVFVVSPKLVGRPFIPSPSEGDIAQNKRTANGRRQAIGKIKKKNE